MESITNLCADLNPTDSSRPVRDAGWLRTQFKALRSSITVVRENFKRSGNQDLENTYDEWVKYCSHGSDVVVYSRCVLSDELMDAFGKALLLLQ
jgi:hypothetical protein